MPACSCAMGNDISIEDLGSGNGTFVNGQRIEGVAKLKTGRPHQVRTDPAAVSKRR